MTDAARLPGDALSVLRETQEVDIETRPAPDVPPHRTTIWVVVAPDDRAFIRTYRGPASRWFREATASAQVALLADGQRIEVRVEPATDAASVDACSAALRAKYAPARAARHAGRRGPAHHARACCRSPSTGRHSPCGTLLSVKQTQNTEPEPRAEAFYAHVGSGGKVEAADWMPDEYRAARAALRRDARQLAS